MVFRRKRSSPGDKLKEECTFNDGCSDTTTASLNEDAQDVIREQLDAENMDLELMRLVVMRIRDDPVYAATIYDDCPRLQLKLIEQPDLRPIFEDPDLVRINFEQVYREAGGKLPEDEEEDAKQACWKRTLKKIVNHPLFKILRFILLIKRLVACVSGGGLALFQGCMQRMCCESFGEAALADVDVEGGEGGDEVYMNPNNAASRAVLNRVADHMADPDVAEAMDELLEKDGEELQEAIENDPELRALRDSSPLCAELMSDPETFKILVDPDNLRALAECPDLIAADMADPDWSPPDLEVGGDGKIDLETGEIDYNYEADYESGDGYEANSEAYHGPTSVQASGAAELADYDVHDVDKDAEVEAEEEEEEEEEEEGEGGLVEDFELGEEQKGDNNMAGKGGGGGQPKQNNQNQNQGGFLSQVGAGIAGMVASEFIGVSTGDFMPGGDGFDDMADQAADEAADQAEEAENAAVAADSTLENANALTEADNLDDHLDTVDDVADNADDKGENDGQTDRTAVAAAGAAGVACAFAPVGMVAPERKAEGEETEEEEKKKGRFGWVGGLAAAVSTAAKESVAGAMFGDDLGGMLMEKREEASESNSEDDDKEKDDKKEEGGKKSEACSDGAENERRKGRRSTFW